MESLFSRHKPKQGRVCLMLGASLLLHSGVVGIGALWTQPEPEPYTLPPTEVLGDFPVSGPTPINVVEVSQTQVSETPEPVATPEVDAKAEATPPEPTELPELAPPLEQTPPPRKLSSSKPVLAVHPTAVQAGPRSLAGPPSDSALGNSASGVKAAGTWVTPHPPYPRTSLGKPTGATTVRIITDATGRVSSVVILKSAGSPLLDNQTESYVRMNWHGPANASRTTEFVYQVR